MLVSFNIVMLQPQKLLYQSCNTKLAILQEDALFVTCFCHTTELDFSCRFDNPSLSLVQLTFMQLPHK